MVRRTVLDAIDMKANISSAGTVLMGTKLSTVLVHILYSSWTIQITFMLLMQDLSYGRVPAKRYSAPLFCNGRAFIS